MSVIQKGSPIVFGIGSGSAKLIKSGNSAETSVFLQDVRMSKGSDTQEVMDGNGEVTGKVFFNQKRTLTMTCFVTADSKANAETAFAVDVDAGDKLIVSYDEWAEVASDDANATLTGSHTDGEGLWVIDTAEKTRTAGGIAEWSLNCTMYANDISDDAS